MGWQCEMQCVCDCERQGYQSDCCFSDETPRCPSQKWSKGKVREKLNNMVCFDQATYDRMMKEVSTYHCVEVGSGENTKWQGVSGSRGPYEINGRDRFCTEMVGMVF